MLVLHSLEYQKIYRGQCVCPHRVHKILKKPFERYNRSNTCRKHKKAASKITVALSDAKASFGDVFLFVFLAMLTQTTWI
ncbi:hypothetical protein B9Q01_08070 [Candidatus Marsarchaeota G1 archaeon OSP_D]|uniref:Uncharacterized protein n=2 Tax=Candidatus Marsarchaeota group 1 TaxID=2203770 RepID=A0A2R6A7R8_9ARCH|nr:MAG: hypothetical protein B9Q01_08070 [Candidatus Marsarchaeota G1 archaeon OSP_D]PSN87214.1 MAG: hypothetical protein B9Q00_09445 [Candidatus Marsarchaeota G1 archaeon OSP_C]